MGSVRIHQVNLVVTDVSAVAQFLIELGVEVPSFEPVWDEHHRSISMGTSRSSGDGGTSGFAIDLDSSAFAKEWGGLPPSFTGAVISIRADERADVDRMHASALALGARTLKAPYDAFWGSRFAVVEGPASCAVGFMSDADDQRRGLPPDPASFV